MKFTDSRPAEGSRYFIRKRDIILAGAGHLLVLVIGMITFSGSTLAPSGGGDAILVRMVTLASPDMTSSSSEIPHPVENPVEVEVETTGPEIIEEPQEEQIPDPVEEIEIPEEQPQHELPEETHPEDARDEAGDFTSLSGEGAAGAGAPGPGTYESRVFNAVRREYRTSVEPERSYRVILTVNIDGSTEIEVVRKSGISAFDRAVENALSRAQIPPIPPGRNTSAVISIEFLGPE